jgi:hypothetical protein
MRQLAEEHALRGMRERSFVERDPTTVEVPPDVRGCDTEQRE